MYAWKYWHDSRDRVILYAAASLVIGLMFGAVILEWYRVNVAYGWLWSRRNPAWDPGRLAWEWGLNSIADYLTPAALWVALSLGAVSVGCGYRSGAMPFLLTRPASRKALVWTDWSLGLAQMTFILASMVVGTVTFLCIVTRAYLWMSWPLLPGCLALGAALYGLTHFTTVLLGSSLKGLSATAAVVLLYTLVPGALMEWWHLSAPLRFRDWSFNVLKRE